jgi:hypothetical protein
MVVFELGATELELADLDICLIKERLEHPFAVPETTPRTGGKLKGIGEGHTLLRVDPVDEPQHLLDDEEAPQAHVVGVP